MAGVQRELRIRFAPFIVTIAIIISFGSFNIGFSLVCITMLEEQVRTINNLEFDQVKYYLSIATSMLPLGAIFGSLLLTRLSRLGENRVMILTDCLSIVASLVLMSSLHIGPLCLGRLLMGIACGLSAGVIPGYLISLSPLDWVGFMGGLHQLLIAVGVGFAFMVGQKLAAVDLWGLANWQAYMMIPIFYSGVRLATLQLFRFDSLEKYYEDDNFGKLKHYMRLFYNRVDVGELIRLKKFSKERKEQDTEITCLGMPQKLLPVALALLALMQLSGINAILLYAKQLFMKIATYNEQRADYYLLLLGVIQILATFTGGWLANQFGRRRTLLVGGVFVSLTLIFTAALYKYDNHQSKGLVLLILLYIVGYAMSIAPAALIYLAELLPDLSRILTFYWGLVLVASLWSGLMLQGLGITGSFLCFGSLSLLCVIFLRSNMVQSQGKTQKQLVNEYLLNNKDAGDMHEYKNMALFQDDNTCLVDS